MMTSGIRGGDLIHKMEEDYLKQLRENIQVILHTKKKESILIDEGRCIGPQEKDC